MNSRTLTAVPVYNEVQHVAGVIEELRQHVDNVLIVDDGSSDGTSDVLRKIDGVRVERHSPNAGYGAALRTAFNFAVRNDFDTLVTIDCDGQHQPHLVTQIAAQLSDPNRPADLVSGSRYLREFEQDSPPPEDRREINRRITACLNEKLGLTLTDAFCGFKAYRVDALRDLDITVPGYAMPLQLWIQAASQNWVIEEFAVPRIYLPEERSFGDSLDDAGARLRYYLSVMNEELERQGMPQRFHANCGNA